MEKFLSIILPVYNVERYLAECLDSCLEQDIPHDDYEIICVNDGSPDNSAEILERYAREHSNIRVITQPNGGLSAARNTGLAAACGAYIWFVDSDDFIRKNCLAELRRFLTETPVDSLSIGYYEFEGAFSPEEHAQMNAGTLQPCTAFSGGLAWDALYRRTFLQAHNLLFLPELRYHEDSMFRMELKHCSPKTGSYPAVLYFYRRNPYSMTRTATPEMTRRRLHALYVLALRATDFVHEDLHALQEAKADRAERARVLMPQVQKIMTFCIPLSAERRREVVQKMSKAGLFPLFLYPNPRDWFPKKEHMWHTNSGAFGKILDILYFYSTTRLGFAVLSFVYQIYNKRKGRDC